MIDIHSHVLPDIDDGPKTWEQTMEMVQQAAEDGISEIAITHHVLSNLAYEREPEILEKFQELQARIERAGLEVKVHLGSEIYVQADMELTHPLSTYNNNGKYFLVEFPMPGIPRFVGERFFDLILDGMVPIIAHPERNATIIRNPERAFEFVQRGALLQLNASSLTGRHGAEVRDTASVLLNSNLVHFVATDAHNTTSRPMRLSPARQVVADGWGKARAQQLFETNPRKAIAGDPIEPPEPLPVQPLKKRPWSIAKLKRIFG